MSDRAVFVLAAVVVCGALGGARLDAGAGRLVVVAGLAVGVAAWTRRRAAPLVLGSGALAVGLSALAWSGVASVQGSVPWRGDAVVAGDPSAVRGGVRVELRLGRRHVDAFVGGEAADLLRDRLAGEHVEVEGRLRPPPDDVRRRLAIRHVSARFDVDAVRGWSPGSAPARAANLLRRTLERGARPLDPVARSLLLGVVLGDDRGRPATLTDDFRASGLSHLLAVSGQSVA